MRIGRALAVACCAAMVFAGCISYETKQVVQFIDDDGNFVTVEYQRGDGDHVTPYVLNGVEHEFKSNLRVIATLPDGESFKAYGCFEPRLMSGIVYKTDDGEWMLNAMGTVINVWKSTLNDQGLPDYVLAYSGVMCQPKKGVKW